MLKIGEFSAMALQIAPIAPWITAGFCDCAAPPSAHATAPDTCPSRRFRVAAVGLDQARSFATPRKLGVQDCRIKRLKRPQNIDLIVTPLLMMTVRRRIWVSSQVVDYNCGDQIPDTVDANSLASRMVGNCLENIGVATAGKGPLIAPDE